MAPIEDKPNKLSGKAGAALHIIFAFLWWTLLAAALVLTTFSHPFNHNEHMYLSAGVLAADHTLYSDFAYLQTPLHPMIHGLIFSFVPPGSYYSAGKVIQIIFSFIEFLLVFLISRRLSKSIWIAYLICFLFLISPFHLLARTQIANYTLASILALASAYTILSQSKRMGKLPAGKGALFLTGLLMGLAISAKLTYVALLPPFALMLFVSLYTSRRFISQWLLKTFVPFSGGVLAGLLPTVLYFLIDPAAFWLCNISYHQQNSEYAQTAWRLKPPLIYRADYLLQFLQDPDRLIPWLAFAFSIILLAGIMIFRLRKHRLSLMLPVEWLIPLLAIFSFLGMIAPYPLPSEYYALYLPFALLLIARTAGLFNRWGLAALGVLTLLQLSFFLGSTDLKLIRSRIPNTSAYPVAKIAEQAQRIADSMKPVDPDKPVLTLGPVPVLEAGRSIYPQFATGRFLYRVSPYLPPPETADSLYWDAQMVASQVTKEPPGAILLGSKGPEAVLSGLIRYYGYQRASNQSQLYFPPSGEIREEAEKERRIIEEYHFGDPAKRWQIGTHDLQDFTVSPVGLRGTATSSDPFVVIRTPRPVPAGQVSRVSIRVRFPGSRMPFIQVFMFWQTEREPSFHPSRSAKTSLPLDGNEWNWVSFDLAGNEGWPDNQVIPAVRLDIANPGTPGQTFELSHVRFEGEPAE